MRARSVASTSRVAAADSALGGIPAGVGAFELDAEAWTRHVWLQRAVDRFRDAVEEQVLDTLVIVKVFEVPHSPECAAGMQVQRGCRVRGERKVVCVTERTDLEESSDTRTSRRVSLQHVDGPCLDHPLEVI